MEAALKYGNFVILAVNLLLGWAAWSMRNAFATKAELSKVHDAHIELTGRVDGLERDLQHMPSKDDLHSLQLELAELVGEIKLVRAEYVNLSGLVQRVESAVTRHEMIISDAARSK